MRISEEEQLRSIEDLAKKQDRRKLPKIKVPRAYSKMEGKTALDWADILVYDSQMLKWEIKHKSMPIIGTIKMIKWDLKRILERLKKNGLK